MNLKKRIDEELRILKTCKSEFPQQAIQIAFRMCSAILSVFLSLNIKLGIN